MHEKTLQDAAREYFQASEALHTTHSSTDVHGRGGIAGQAITDHCAWECKALDARVSIDPVTGKATVVGSGVSLHFDEIQRWEKARKALASMIFD